MAVTLPLPMPDVTVRPVEKRMPRWRAYGRLLFGTPLNAALTLVFVGAFAWSAPGLIRWAVLDAVFWTLDPNACRATDGACWSFIYAKSGQILFGIYPPAERWRAALACAVILVLLAVSVRPQLWGHRLFLGWIGAMAAVVVLMAGGVPGLPAVPTSSWGGLPVTLILTVFAIGVAFPLSRCNLS